MYTLNQTTVFAEWLAQLADAVGKGLIVARIEAAKSGNFGDCGPVGDGVAEMKIHFGPGYRVYFMREGRIVYLLLCGGDKSSQKADIRSARSMAIQVRKDAKAAAKADKVKLVQVMSKAVPMKTKGKSTGKTRKG